MYRDDLSISLQQLDLTQRPEEEAYRQAMVALLKHEPGCFHRDCYQPGHFTGSALVVSADGTRALLHHHRKLDRWLQFGGHCDGDENVLRVACREAEEESGIAGLIVASAKPWDLDIHEIPARGAEPAHLHYDVRFMLIAPAGAEGVISAESHALGWFTPEEVMALPVDASVRRMVGKWQRIRERRQHR